jgi:hypothetical protein
METTQENVKKVKMTSYEDEEDVESVIKKKRSSLVKTAKKETSLYKMMNHSQKNRMMKQPILQNQNKEMKK